MEIEFFIKCICVTGVVYAVIMICIWIGVGLLGGPVVRFPYHKVPSPPEIPPFKGKV